MICMYVSIEKNKDYNKIKVDMHMFCIDGGWDVRIISSGWLKEPQSETGFYVRLCKTCM